jgi:acetyl-CoA carboxylase biotin carboxyl carrier protein
MVNGAARGALQRALRVDCMNIDEIKTLTELMIENDLSEIMLRDGEKRIILRRGPSSKTLHSASHATAVHATAPMSVPTHAPSPAPPADDAGLAKIASPMVGTFYAAPAPDAAPFVRLGDKVNPETVVCIIEAMKVFNEIKADVAGTIESIDVVGGTAVEFGQVLMKVRTA